VCTDSLAGLVGSCCRLQKLKSGLSCGKKSIRNETNFGGLSIKRLSARVQSRSFATLEGVEDDTDVYCSIIVTAEKG